MVVAVFSVAGARRKAAVVVGEDGRPGAKFVMSVAAVVGLVNEKRLCASEDPC